MIGKTTHRNLIFLLALAAACATLLVPEAFAQCAMCKAAAAGLDRVSARTLNLATLILLCPPVAIFCGIFVVAYKHRQAPGDRDDASTSEKI
jgi:heme/copper-type cytochrome/quinol oxidase subunit 2